MGTPEKDLAVVLAVKILEACTDMHPGIMQSLPSGTLMPSLSEASMHMSLARESCS